ncbi:beta-lactamase regulating signal transducer with metallopeptidase domain [Aquimarina sp. MAR_2010_214]|uniref:M56 family metallopeptidase n=1 Tax=Aquimarina sp. MAR_2010_214 TaxID=1250026 RepID=UPI000C705C21|nr:M56 family metallopeptidase [Aquimarina sp. MAR_2010_214]PKV48227.1 beta-lactamase regulating signal transducer with metallopeptidase domain [Aquimarina sp. MAR_2010_214]
MIIYVIKSSLCLMLLWSFYRLFLERENMHHFKRFYLLFSLIFAYTIPLITITYETDVIVNLEKSEPVINEVILANNVQSQAPSLNYLSILLWSVYAIGALIFSVRFIKNIYHLIKKVRRNENLKESSHINVLLTKSMIPHTFLHYIFVPKKEFQKKTIPQEVLLHEKTHVRQKHTLDILFVEIFQVIFWFNPMWFWVKKSIKLNHEFLADQKVLKQQFSIHQYMDLLVNYPNSSHQTALASPINYSLTKKRIVMMSQQFSKTKAATRLLLFLPILFGCILLFNNKMVAQQKSTTVSTTVAPTHPDKKIKIRVSGEQININGTTTDLSGLATVIDNATKQWKDHELTEFQFNVKLENTNDKFIKKLNKVYRNTRLYKANPDGHDLIPPPPPAPLAPPKVGVNTVPMPQSYPKAHKALKAPKPPKPHKAPKVSKLPKVPSYSQTEHEEIEHEAELAMQAAEVAMEAVEREAAEREALVEQIEVERTLAMERREEARYEAEQVREIAMEQAEKARVVAMEESNRARERSHKVREEAMRHAERVRFEAEKQAMVHTKMAREEARMAMQQAEKARAMARSNVDKSRRKAEKARRKAMDEAKIARDVARKEVVKERKEARKRIQKSKKEQQRARRKVQKENN